MENQRIELAVDEAELAFWKVISEHFPEIKTGDLCFSICMPLTQKNIDAVKAWYESNKK